MNNRIKSKTPRRREYAYTEQKTQSKSTQNQKSTTPDILSKSSQKSKYLLFSSIAGRLANYHLDRCQPGEPSCTYHFCQFLELLDIEHYFSLKASFHSQVQNRGIRS